MPNCDLRGAALQCTGGTTFLCVFSADWESTGNTSVIGTCHYRCLDLGGKNFVLLTYLHTPCHRCGQESYLVLLKLEKVDWRG